MKVSNPYGANDNFKSPPEIISSERAQNGSKAKARFPHKPLGPSQKNSAAGKMQRPAYTPGTVPTGS
jgi:hypothetical protein